MAEEPSDVFCPNQPHDPREKTKGHQQDGGGESRMRVRRAQQPQAARPPRTPARQLRVQEGFSWLRSCHWTRFYRAGARTRRRFAKYPVRMRHCMRRTFGWGLVLLMAAGAGAAGQAIHGGGGSTLPPPPAVEAIPV